MTIPNMPARWALGLVLGLLVETSIGVGTNETQPLQALVQPKRSLRASNLLRWSGQTWDITNDPSAGSGPDGNLFASSHVHVGADGDLHLRMSPFKGRWRGAQLVSTTEFGYGRYTWTIKSQVDNLDTNVVLGLFTYPASGQGPDGTDEIDIEFSKWGDPTATANLGWTVYPSKLNQPGIPSQSNKQVPFSYAPATGAATSTHSFIWHAGGIHFQSYYGSVASPAHLAAQWRFKPPQPRKRIPQVPCQVLMNLWLVSGKPPTDGQAVEVILQSFSYAKNK